MIISGILLILTILYFLTIIALNSALTLYDLSDKEMLFLFFYKDM